MAKQGRKKKVLLFNLCDRWKLHSSVCVIDRLKETEETFPPPKKKFTLTHFEKIKIEFKVCKFCKSLEDSLRNVKVACVPSKAKKYVCILFFRGP